MVHQNSAPIWRLHKNLYKSAFHFLGFFHWTVSNLFFCCVTVKTIYYHAVDNAGQTADNKHTGSMIFPFFLLASKTDKPLGDDTFQNQSVKLIR